MHDSRSLYGLRSEPTQADSEFKGVGILISVEFDRGSRDRAGAIRPDFSVCVGSRCTLVGRASAVIACLSRSLLESGKGVGGLPFGLLGRRSAAISVGAFSTWFGFVTLRACLARTGRCYPNMVLFRGPFFRVGVP